MKIVDVLSKEYGSIARKYSRTSRCRMPGGAIQSREVSALLIVIPLTGKIPVAGRDIFQAGPQGIADTDPDRVAGAIAEAERAYESFDIPKRARYGGLRRS